MRLWTEQPGPNESLPMNCVYREQAKQFAAWVGGALPTEVQWYHAARGGHKYPYAGSRDAREVAWYGFPESSSPKPGGQKKPNGYGLFDMSGNLMEWVQPDKHSHSDEFWSGCEDHIFRGGAWFYLHLK